MGQDFTVTPSRNDNPTNGVSTFDIVLISKHILNVEKLNQKAEATVHMSGGEVFATAEHNDMYAAIDGLIDKLDRQVIKHKEKMKRH